MTLRDVLTPILSLLRQENIPFAVIGGYAASTWGRIRATRDLDLLCEVSDLDRLKSALTVAAIPFEHDRGDVDDPVKHVLHLAIPPGHGIDEVEVLAGIHSAPSDIPSRARFVEVDGLDIPIAAPEDMIILKLLAGSELDRDDARTILKASGNKIDRPLLRSICPSSIRGDLDELLSSGT